MATPFWIKIKNWDKHNPRKDIKEPKWFAFSNKLIEDEDFFEFTHGEFKALIYLYSKASQKKSAVIRVSPAHAKQVCNISFEEMESAVKKLKSPDLKIVVDPSQEEIDRAISGDEPADVSTRTESVRGANGSVQNQTATGEDRGGQDSTGEGSTEHGPKPAAAQPSDLTEIECGPVPEFANGAPHVLAVLARVPKSLQNIWIDTWEDIHMKSRGIWECLLLRYMPSFPGKKLLMALSGIAP